MCGLHYQEFVQSVDQLLKVREGTSTIKDKIVGMNDDIQTFGKKMIEKKWELVENRQKVCFSCFDWTKECGVLRSLINDDQG